MNITSYPPAIPFDLSVAQGKLTGYQTLYRSAYSNNISTTRSTIRSAGSTYVFPSSASVMKVSSSSTADVGQLLLVDGLDSNYAQLTEIVTLNGQTAVNTVNSFFRINALTIITDSPNTVGNIYVGIGTVTAGVPATVYGYVASSDRTSQSTVYTVPAGKTYYVTNGSISSGTTASGNKYITAYFMSRLNGVQYTGSTIGVTTSFQQLQYNPPLALVEKTDIWTDALTNSGTDSVEVTINGYLVTNGS